MSTKREITLLIAVGLILIVLANMTQMVAWATTGNPSVTGQTVPTITPTAPPTNTPKPPTITPTAPPTNTPKPPPPPADTSTPTSLIICRAITRLASLTSC